MKKTILSTADVARLFNVTETTVKRWANDGALKCMKTPGGHRKFAMKHVVEFAESLKFEPAGTLALTAEDTQAQRIQVAILDRDFTVLKDAFIEKALSPDKRDLFLYFSYLYQHRIHLWELYDKVIAPGMAEVGERWAAGTLDVNDEHRASYETLDALAMLQSQIHRKERNGLSALFACPGEEQHDIGLRCASYLFESEGWMTHYLGARTPHNSIVKAVHELQPKVICLSITNEPERTAMLDLLERLRSAQTQILIGGRAARSNGSNLREYATTYHSTFELCSILNDLGHDDANA